MSNDYDAACRRMVHTQAEAFLPWLIPGFARVAKQPAAISSYLESTALPGVHADNDMIEHAFRLSRPVCFIA